MTGEQFFTLFKRSAWRLEALPAYGTVQSDPSFAAYLRAGRVVPPLEERPPKQTWMAAVRQAIAGGKRLGRVHVLSRPLSPYLEYELATYPENVEAGEDVRIADAGEHPELADLGPDFWLLDDETPRPAVLLMTYDDAGRFLSLEHTTEPIVVARCRRVRDLAVRCSVPLSEFLAIAR
jgi:hypothetical protein